MSDNCQIGSGPHWPNRRRRFADRTPWQPSMGPLEAVTGWTSRGSEQGVRWTPLSRPKTPDSCLLLGGLSLLAGMHLRRRPILQRLVQPLLVVEPEVGRQAPLQLRHRLVP